MIKAAVLGSPISHSLSPKIHKKAYEVLGLNGDYSAIEINESNFAEFFAKEQSSDWNGFSLTMPLKEVAFLFCSQISEFALRTNSANTLINNSGVWSATSTDYLAFENLLVVDPSAAVAIIGGGGTARAAAGALNSRLEKLDVLLRNTQRVSALQKAAPDLEINVKSMDSNLSGYDLVIQTTPAGAFDQYVAGATIKGTLMECIYNPWPTQLVTSALANGNKVISGAELLVEQALFQIQLFTGMDFDFPKMRATLLNYLAQN